IGLEADFQGVVDLVRMQAAYFDGDNGERIRYEEIPADLVADAQARREEMLDAVSMFSDELMEAMLEDRVTEDLIHEAVRKAVLARKLTPVFIGSAYKNKGVQLLLDAVVRYLPCPTDVENQAFDIEQKETPVPLVADPAKPTVALAFKLEDGRYGQLTYVRVYQGHMAKGDTLVNARTGKRFKVGRLVRMHASQMEEIEASNSGDIVAMFGIDCATGDTFSAEGARLSMTSMYVPEPVISLAIVPKDSKAQVNMSKALNRFSKEDPTFRTFVDAESGETIIQGMGELHLDVYVERMKREYAAEVATGQPQVAYRETISQRADFNYLHRKQTGGSGQYGKVAGYLEPLEEGDYEFVDNIVGGAIPREFISSCDKGFQACLKKGSLIGAPVTGVRALINDGNSHAVDSSDMAFQQAAIGAFREGYAKAKPIILEPIMKVVVETPSEFQGSVLGTLNQRRGIIVGTSEDGVYSVVEAEVPLSEMFGYSTTLRSGTQGKAEFTMEFAKYRPVPQGLAEELKKKYQEELKKKSAA
ncbi:MAG: elongation factor G, partial [Deferrisomatales bacterium]